MANLQGEKESSTCVHLYSKGRSHDRQIHCALTEEAIAEKRDYAGELSGAGWTYVKR